MSDFGDDGSVSDLLNDNIQIADADLLPGEPDGNDIFGSEEAENAEGPTAVPIKVQAKKRTVLNPRPRLSVEVLSGTRGLHTIEEYFKDIKYKGKGYEKQDLEEIMRRLQHWGHRMYPTYKFDDVLSNIERLGKKKPLQVYMSRYRLGMLEIMKNHGEIIEGVDDEEEQPANTGDEPYDEFDALLDEQIAISKVAPRTPVANKVRHSSGGMDTNFDTPSFSRKNAVISTPYTGCGNLNDSDLATPLPASQPLTPANKQLTTEQMARIAENRRLAQERLAAKKRLQQSQKPVELVKS